MDELQGLFAANPEGFASNVQYVQGTILSWTPTTGANVVAIPGGTQLTNVKLLSSNVFTNFTIGDSVALMLINNQYTIMGKIKSAGNGLEQLQSASTTASEGTTSTTYTDLATVGPVVTAYIGPSGSCLVLHSCTIIAGINLGFMSYTVSGANTIPAASPLIAAVQYGPASTATAFSQVTGAQFNLLTGLNRGNTTFTAKYAISGTVSISFAGRKIIVIPL